MRSKRLHHSAPDASAGALRLGRPTCLNHASCLRLAIVVSGQVNGTAPPAYYRPAVACIGNQQGIPCYKGGQRCRACIPLWLVFPVHRLIEVLIRPSEGVDLHVQLANVRPVMTCSTHDVLSNMLHLPEA